MGLNGQLHVSAALNLRKEPRVTIEYKSGLPKSRSDRIVSTFVKYVSCFGDNVYQDSSSLTQLFYKELSKCYYLTVLHHVNYVYK
jgi:hypothetical protein